VSEPDSEALETQVTQPSVLSRITTTVHSLAATVRMGPRHARVPADGSSLMPRLSPGGKFNSRKDKPTNHVLANDNRGKVVVSRRRLSFRARAST